MTYRPNGKYLEVKLWFSFWWRQYWGGSIRLHLYVSVAVLEAKIHFRQINKYLDLESEYVFKFSFQQTSIMDLCEAVSIYVSLFVCFSGSGFSLYFIKKKLCGLKFNLRWEKLQKSENISQEMKKIRKINSPCLGNYVKLRFHVKNL